MSQFSRTQWDPSVVPIHIISQLKRKEESCIISARPLWPEGCRGGPRGLISPSAGHGRTAWLLWAVDDVDFGDGKAKPTCTTYGSPQLSAQEDFQVP